MSKQTCCECKRRRDNMRAVIKYLSGVIDNCCRKCWKELDYDPYMKRKP